MGIIIIYFQAADNGTEQVTSRPLSHILSRLRVAFGTFVAVEAEAPDLCSVERAISAAFSALATVERLMHPTHAGSDLARLALCEPGGAVPLDPWTYELLRLCARLHRSSGGRFDPCLPGAAGRLPDLDLSEAPVARVRVPARLDLGGIAKGFAVDRAVDAMRVAGCTGGLVNAGGDLAAFGARAHRIVCRTARGKAVVKLRDAALATSEVGHPHARGSQPPEHRGHYHGVDGTPAARGAVTVIAASAALADGLTKCLLLATAAERARLLRLFDAREVPYQNASPRPRSKRLKSALYSNH
jgi:thiamine biosynthesis lipoprotein